MPTRALTTMLSCGALLLGGCSLIIASETFLDNSPLDGGTGVDGGPGVDGGECGIGTYPFMGGCVECTDESHCQAGLNPHCGNGNVCVQCRNLDDCGVGATACTVEGACLFGPVCECPPNQRCTPDGGCEPCTPAIPQCGNGLIDGCGSPFGDAGGILSAIGEFGTIPPMRIDLAGGAAPFDEPQLSVLIAADGSTLPGDGVVFYHGQGSGAGRQPTLWAVPFGLDGGTSVGAHEINDLIADTVGFRNVAASRARQVDGKVMIGVIGERALGTFVAAIYEWSGDFPQPLGRNAGLISLDGRGYAPIDVALPPVGPPRMAFRATDAAGITSLQTLASGGANHRTFPPLMNGPGWWMAAAGEVIAAETGDSGDMVLWRGVDGDSPVSATFPGVPFTDRAASAVIGGGQPVVAAYFGPVLQVLTFEGCGSTDVPLAGCMTIHLTDLPTTARLLALAGTSVGAVMAAVEGNADAPEVTGRLLDSSGNLLMDTTGSYPLAFPIMSPMLGTGPRQVQDLAATSVERADGIDVLVAAVGNSGSGTENEIWIGGARFCYSP